MYDDGIYKLKAPLTIEKQLENYTQRDGHTDRHDVLWHAWCQNKRWLGQILQITLHSFPTYSRHDESHALSVINNIEMLLGQDRISDLSATDCFVLLHTVYIHDIGMCITKRDRKEIIENEEFIRMLDRLQTDGDETVKKAIECLKRTDYQVKQGDSKKDYYERAKELYRAKLDVYYAILELLADFRRSEHGEKSAERLYDWTLNPEKLGAGFSMAGVPLRIFLSIARCAQMHTSGKFEEIKNLPKKDGGYASDYYHPRFISVLLMLGDILDMDNDRFHPMVLEFVEDFPETSYNHYDKHRAIKRLHVSPEKIEIEADCQNQNALRLVRQECDMLAEILKNAGYMWSDICPEGFRGSLPVLEETELYLKGQKIPEELVTAQFSISQKKAFDILEGANLYEDRFVFLREFLQNAIDATKMQYWNDYKGMEFYYLDEDGYSPDKMNQKLSLDKYPVEISMKMQKKDSKGETSDVTQEDVIQIKTGAYKNYEYGVLVTIKDYATGIDKDNILAISKVGNSRYREWRVIHDMPKWLRPTAEFGVGLQSAFLLTQGFKCYTHTRNGERYEIIFNSGASSMYQGYINVIPWKRLEGKYETYGTDFEVFVPLEKKFKHEESLCTWGGEDPFSDEYEANRPFRHAAELISQMAVYLDKLLGELLFPVILRISKIPKANLSIGLPQNVSIKKMVYCPTSSHWRNKYKKSWIFKKTTGQSEEYLFGKVQEVNYAYEFDTCKLLLLNEEIDTFCAISGINLLKLEKESQRNRHQEIPRKGITIYYKGIELQYKCVEEETDIFEYIDIKGELQRSYINISRRGFTPEGTKYFEEEIYTKLLNSVKLALKDINSQINKQESNTELLYHNAKEKLNKLSSGFDEKNEEEYKDEIRKLAEQLLSIAFLSVLAEKGLRDEMSRFGEDCSEKEACNWNKAINELIKVMKEEDSKSSNGLKLKGLTKYSTLFNIESYIYKDNSFVEDTITILDIFSRDKHYGILQKRENPSGDWIAYIISLDEKKYKFCENAILGETQDIRNTSAKEMEKLFNDMFSLSRNLGTSVLDEHKYEQQFFLTWLLKNIPLIGVGSNNDGNVRVNIISNYTFSSIYTNLNHKILIMERILDVLQEKNISRYSTYAWQGKQYLSVKNIPFSCFFIKKGYLNHVSLHKVIIPLSKDLLMEIKNTLKSVEKREFVKNVQSLVSILDFKSFCQNLIEKYDNNQNLLSNEEKSVTEKIKITSNNAGKSVTSLILDIYEFFVEILQHFSQEESDIDEAYFDQIRLESALYGKAYISLINLYLALLSNGEVKTKEIYDNKRLKFLAKGWRFLKEELLNDEVIKNHLEIPKLKTDYQSECKNNLNLQQQHQRIIDFIKNNLRYTLQKDKLELCYYALIDEIFDIYQEIEKRNLKIMLKKILGSLNTDE